MIWLVLVLAPSNESKLVKPKIPALSPFFYKREKQLLAIVQNNPGKLKPFCEEKLFQMGLMYLELIH